VRPEIQGLLDRYGGVVTRGQLLAVLPVHVVDSAVRNGALRRLFPRTYTAPELVGQPEIRRRGALRYAGEEAALSHTTGLSAWDIPVTVEDVLHVVTDRSRQLGGRRAAASGQRPAASGQRPAASG